jgi:multisubunit Na+/H+ antiporter MnhE subunit
MKKLLFIFPLFMIIGMPNVLLYITLFNYEHSVWFVVTSYLSAFFGTGLIFGFIPFGDEPSFIGNIDNNETKPSINQNWIVFFISLIINLTVANFCGNV